MLQELQVKTGFAPREHWIGSTTKHWLHCDLPFFMATIAQCDDRFNDLSAYRGAVSWPPGEKCDAVPRTHRPFPIRRVDVANGRQIPAIARRSGAGKNNAVVLHLSDCWGAACAAARTEKASPASAGHGHCHPCSCKAEARAGSDT